MDKFDFNSRFSESKGEPIYYNGKAIILSDKVPAMFNERFLVTIEETNSILIQGIGLSGDIEVFGQKGKRSMILESFSIPPDQRARVRSKLPFEFEVISKSKKGFITIYNMAIEDGRQEWWVYACGMIKEEIENGFRYRCNDKQPNDDFNDIVFKIERIK